jgi:hypothetical protein
MEPTNITTEDHLDAIRSLLGDPKNRRHAVRVRRGPRGS